MITLSWDSRNKIDNLEEDEFREVDEGQILQSLVGYGHKKGMRKILHSKGAH